MTDAAERSFDVPATVNAYLTDPAMRAAVDALLEARPGSLPAGLRLNELADYLAARAAAELTKYDWAIAMHALWDATWGAGLGPAWRPATIDEALDEEFAITPESCWNEGSFAFRHVRGLHTFFSAVAFDQSQTQLAFSVETADEALATEGGGGFVWMEDEDWTGWLVTTIPRSPAHPDFAIADLTPRIASALALAEEIVST
ncbi:hypothetical protein [Sphingomonas sp. R86521]|uniref:hypothetical protein n=1 Tax=Sphingomonas sp. R86521 TaxID=3093860 RepID=UPI0036D2EA6C